ncbi:hypothetical protein Tco_0661984, partial [Tanacetum coccineum]
MNDVMVLMSKRVGVAANNFGPQLCVIPVVFRNDMLDHTLEDVMVPDGHTPTDGNTTCDCMPKWGTQLWMGIQHVIVCQNGERNFGYRCKCPKGFWRNTYIQNGFDQ